LSVLKRDRENKRGEKKKESVHPFLLVHFHCRTRKEKRGGEGGMLSLLEIGGEKRGGEKGRRKRSTMNFICLVNAKCKGWEKGNGW